MILGFGHELDILEKHADFRFLWSQVGKVAQLASIGKFELSIALSELMSALQNDWLDINLTCPTIFTHDPIRRQYPQIK